MKRTLWTALWLCLFLAFLWSMIFRPLPPMVGESLSYVVQTATVLTACVLMALRARAAQGALRRTRALLSASLLCATVGGVLALVVRLTAEGAPPVPSIADAIHFVFLPLCVAGLLSCPVSKDVAGSRAQMLLDGVVAATALWFVTYTLLLAPAQVGAQVPLLTAVTILGYPAADVFVIAMAAGALRRVAAEARQELALSAAGVTLYGLSDIAYTVLAARGSYAPDSWVGALAEVGLLLILVAVLRRETPTDLPAAWTSWVGAVPYASVAIALVFAVTLALLRDGLGQTELLLLVAVMAALLVRQLVANRDRDSAARRLRESQVLFRSLVVGSSDLITLHGLDGTLMYASPAVSRLTGVAPERLARVPLSELVHPEDVAAVLRLARGLRRQPATSGQLFLRVRAGDDSWRWCQTVARNLLDDPGVRGIICNTRDVHERHLLEQQVHHDARHDPLTGLGNLAQARELLERAVAQRRIRGTVAALVDLDGFKQVNDTFGHVEGDALLTAVAHRLRGCARNADAVTRIGGDEFLFVLRDDGGAGGVAGDVLESLRAPLLVNGRSLTIGASIGLASVHDCATPDELLRNADLAMYAAKAAGRNRLAWFEPRMHETAQRNMMITADLRRALKQGDFQLHYQPVVHLPAGRIAFVEALIRWQDRDGQLLSPDVFIPLAEEAGLMPEVDAWVLDRACADLATWQRQGVDIPQVSVNISRRHLTPDLPSLVSETLRRHGLSGPQLCMEVTESAVAPDPAATTAVLRSVRALGVQIALDDFGVGQSSLSDLAELPIDLVKVDRSFLAAPERTASLPLLTSIIGLCRAVGLPVVAEGIEDDNVVEHLIASGCAYGQGFALGAPQPAGTLSQRRFTRASRALPAP